LDIPATNCSTPSTPQPIAVFEAALEREGEWTGELNTKGRAMAAKILVESRQVLVGETDGRRLVLETNRDITERTRAKRRCGRRRRISRTVSRVTTMGELTASIAHEVNQPLTGVVNKCQWPVLACCRRSAPNLEGNSRRPAEIIGDAERRVTSSARGSAVGEEAPCERTLLEA